MRFNFELPEPTTNTNTNKALTLTPTPPSQSQSQSQSPSPSTPATDDVDWLPLQNHPVFSTSNSSSNNNNNNNNNNNSIIQRKRNLMAWDGASRLYYWNVNTQSLHRLSLRFGEPDPSFILATSPSKVLRPDVELNFTVDRITINRHGSALLLEGSNGLCVMYLYGRSSSKDSSVICRTIYVGSNLYLNTNNAIRTLKVSWHPYSDTHLGILSSDSVFRLYDLSSAIEQPEQEYYLQPVSRGRSRNASSICPVDFSFGGDHLWDRFSVFVLFSDGAVYILCPVVPFGSMYKWESVLEIYNDAQTFGLNSGSSKASSNETLAISWLEATFPELAKQAAEGGVQPALKSHPYALFDASVPLQGPLHKVYHGNEEDSEFKVTECEGRAVSFLYKAVYFELKHHGPQLKKIIDEQHARLREAQQKLAKVEEKQEKLENRLDRAIETHGMLEERLINLRNLPGIHKKPLSKAEREFKMELDRFRGLELDALHTTIEAINGRIKRYSSFSPQTKRPNQRRQIALAGRRKGNAEDDEISHLKSAIEKLSLVNSENTKKVKLVDSALRNRESTS
ncbi:nuclear pore complex protein NUP88-like [Bidens hawaiensis]|uniref:nuclear pore complex protein NUP88-like n=1 Tax=Bidens hawaiensis TaxID=980011 RepID=UPI00404A3E8B